MCEAQDRRRRAGEEGRHRGRLLAHPRRQGRAAPPGHGHLRRRRERQPLRRPVLRRVQLPARQERPVRRALSPHAHDRPGARHLRRLGGAAQGADGRPICFNSDVVATAKRALKKGEVLDGEGGFCVWGRQTPADVSLQEGYLPLGLAHGVALNARHRRGPAARAGPTSPSMRPPMPSRSAARWRRCSRGRTGDFPLSPFSRGEGRGEGQPQAAPEPGPAPHPNPLPTEEWGEGIP